MLPFRFERITHYVCYADVIVCALPCGIEGSSIRYGQTSSLLLLHWSFNSHGALQLQLRIPLSQMGTRLTGKICITEPLDTGHVLILINNKIFLY